MAYEYNIGNKEDWLEAGRITREALNYAEKIIENGTSIFDASEKIENFIKKQSDLAFPLNISMNEFAAHDCAGISDERTIEGVVKVDLGANVNGAIGDAAITIDLTDKFSDLLEANKLALKKAIDYVTSSDQIEVKEISRVLYETAKEKGYGVILNLSGHGIKRNQIHTEPSVPAIPFNDSIISKNFVFAIEPFFTLTDSKVVERGNAKIFQKISDKPIRDYKARKILKYLDKFSGNPFASRWLLDEFKEEEIEFSLSKLVRNNNIIEYKPLMNVNKDVVSQFENTIVLHNDVEVSTQEKE